MSVRNKILDVTC